MKVIRITILILFLFGYNSYSQQEIRLVEKELNQLAVEVKQLEDKVEFDVSGLNLYELITTIAEEHKLNVSVSSDLDDPVISNFYDLKVKDVFLFLVREYDIDLQIFNGIIIFNKKEIIAKPKPPKQLRKLNIIYKQHNDFLSIDLKNDSLPRVAEKITDLSGKNVVLAPDIRSVRVSAYIKNKPFDQVLEMMAKSNGLVVNKNESEFYYIEKGIPVVQEEILPVRNIKGSKRKAVRTPATSSGDFEITLNENGFLKVKATNADISSLILEAAEKVNINYFLYDELEGQTTLYANGITFDGLIQYLFKGNEYSYKVVDDFYFIGENKGDGLRSTELIQLENRTIESVLDAIPNSLTNGLEVEEFVELDGLIVSGAQEKIDDLKRFIFQIDKVVPLVQIEVLIVQYKKSYEIQTGIQAGIGENPAPKTTGAVLPNVDMSFNASSVNGLINAFNGLGIINIGKVTPNFYLNLKALENNSVIKVQSTPKIATLSGHEASVSIGETDYYFELSNRLVNSGIGNDVLQSGTWKSTEANLSVNIKPYVSTDGHVTLTINVDKSAFLPRAGENAPPGKTSQKFDALIRVKDGEMILLGGLDETDRSNSGTGTPVLSRIPIIKWFFSSRTKSKERSKLHVFIKPTIIY